MKRMRLLTIMFATMVVGGVMAQDEYNTWPWDFPQNIKLEVELGQTVLSPEGHYFAAIDKKEDLSKATLIWYDKKVDKVGDGTVTITKFGEKREVPNALIIPLKKQQKAKKGDILLTWWQGGSGLQRAIVNLIYHAQVIDVHWDFRVVDGLQHVDDAFFQTGLFFLRH